METVSVSPKFQVVIPRRIREALGLRPGQKMQAINRLQMPKDSPLVMPPVRAAELSADEIQAAVQALSQ